MRAAYRGTQAETIASSVPNVLQIVNELQVTDRKATSFEVRATANPNWEGLVGCGFPSSGGPVSGVVTFFGWHLRHSVTGESNGYNATDEVSVVSRSEERRVGKGGGSRG